MRAGSALPRADAMSLAWASRHSLSLRSFPPLCSRLRWWPAQARRAQDSYSRAGDGYDCARRFNSQSAVSTVSGDALFVVTQSK